MIQDQNKKTVARGRKKGHLYTLDDVSHEALAAIRKAGPTSLLWHQRLGHPNLKILYLLKEKKVIDVSLWISKQSVCVRCQMGKSCKLPFHLSNKISDFPLEKIHCDLWGPASLTSNQKFRFYAIFVDDFSRFTWLYPLRRKSEFLDCFKNFQRLVENKFDRRIKIFQCDGGGEFNSRDFHTHIQNHGTELHISCPGTPEQNGVAERKHRHIVETSLTMLFHANLPLTLWVDVFLSAVYLINRLPSSVLHNDTPYHKLHKQHPDYRGLRVIGCKCFPSLRYQGGNKFLKKTYPCVFIGYSPMHKGYRCLEPKTKRVYISRHVVFDEGVFPYKISTTSAPTSTELSFSEFPSFDESSDLKGGNLSISNSPSDPEILTELSKKHSAFFESFQSCDKNCNAGVSSNIVLPEQNAPTNEDNNPTNHGEIARGIMPSQVESIIGNTSGETSGEPSGGTFGGNSTDKDINNVHQSLEEQAMEPIPLEDNSIIHSQRPTRIRQVPAHLKDYALATTTSPFEPKTPKTALKDANWVRAMKEELQALQENQTWTLVPRPPETNVVSSKWVYRIKYKEDGNIERFKARLVARGFTQVSGLDYDETFSPVVKSTTIRLVIALSTSLKWHMRQLDVKNAFLHGYLRETVYMEQPLGFINHSYPDHVCLLKRSLYGLKQAPRAWFDRLSQFLLHLGFYCSKADSSLFIYRTNTITAILLIYVDDILVVGNTDSFITNLINHLGNEFAIKDLGSLRYFLGVEIKSFAGGVHLSQTKYIQDLLTRTKMIESTPMSTPMVQKEKPSASDMNLVDPTEFRSIVGALQYLTFTRPDIIHSVNYVCQFFSAPTQLHLKAVKRILRYLKGTSHFGLSYLAQSPLSLYGFSDADWAGCPVTRRSTTGFCIFLGANCISWCSKKQPTVARSSSEAEYRSMASTTAEITWLTFLLRDIGITLPQPPQLFCDNISALYMSVNPTFHARSKHIELDYHFVREKVAMGTLVTRYISSSNQPADIFTKPLSKQAFIFFRDKLGVHARYPSSLKGRVKDNNPTNHGDITDAI